MRWLERHIRSTEIEGSAVEHWLGSHTMSRFSARVGQTPVRTVVQLESMDDALRNGLWTAFHEAYQQTEIGAATFGGTHAALYRAIWIELFRLPGDSLPQFKDRFYESLRKWFFSAGWAQVYDFIEFVAQQGRSYRHGQYLQAVNYFLAREMAAYRLIDGLITPITSEAELASIESAMEVAHASGLAGVPQHLRRALELLSDRANPDYRNSIKESISAIESISLQIAGTAKAGVADALKVLEAKIGLHGALKSAFTTMYGYSSDQDGIRHAILGEKDISAEDALFMLIACSAFINYLVAKSQKAGVSLA